jgi:O-antigen/teichoic acid export membrane protein
MSWSSTGISLLRRGTVGYGLVVVAQVSSAVAGLLFVNFLSKEEFALFAVCTALLQAIVAQSDLGTLAAVGYFYREHPNWNSFRKISLPAIASVRFKFFVFAGMILPLLFVMSDASKGIPVIKVLELLALTLGAAWFGMANGFQSLALRVRGDVNTSIFLDIAGGFTRLALAAGIIVVQLLNTETALLTTLLSLMLSFTIGRFCVPGISLGISPQGQKNEQKKVFRYVLPLIPGSLYYTLQPSILIWLSMVYGSTNQVAEVGAIGRVGQIISFLGFGLTLFVLPHLASLRDDKAFKRSYASIWLILVSVAAIVFFAIVVSRGGIVMLLGANYANLGNEIILVAATSLLSVGANYAVLVNRVRGWNKLEPLSTVFLFTGQAVLIAFLPLDSTTRILWMGLLYGAWHLIVNTGINAMGFFRPASVAISDSSITPPPFIQRL